MLVAVNHTTRKINLFSDIPRNFDRKYWFYVNTFVPNAPFLYPSKTYNRFLMFSGGRAGGSRTIAPEKNMPSTPKLTLTQTLTQPGSNFPRGQLSGCLSTLKLTLTLIQTPTLTGGQFSSEAIVRIPSRGALGTKRVKHECGKIYLTVKLGCRTKYLPAR